MCSSPGAHSLDPHSPCLAKRFLSIPGESHRTHLNREGFRAKYLLYGTIDRSSLSRAHGMAPGPVVEHAHSPRF